jgi:hypothetical protein
MSRGAGRGSAGAFALAVTALLGSVFPFVGLAGVIAIGLALRDRGGTRRALRGLAIGLGGASTAVALGWAVVFCAPEKPIAHATCPRVQSWDGASYRLDADLVAGSLYPWAERLDVAPAAHLAASEGEVRLRIEGDSESEEQIDSFELWSVTGDPAVEILPSLKGGLFAVRDAAAPLRAVDASGADVRPLAAAADGRLLESAVTTGSDGEPAQSWTLEFARPGSAGGAARALLVLRAHGTAFAEEAFARYLARMGQGMGPFMEWVAKEDCPCSEEVFDDETGRLGIPLRLTVAPGTSAAPVHLIWPVGPAALRSFVVPIDLPPGAPGERVTLRLESTPRFWEIDRAALAPHAGGDLPPTILRLRSALLSSPGRASEDVAGQLARADRRRIALRTGDLLDLRFEAPAAAPVAKRSLFFALRGFYRVPVGGKRLIDPAAVLSHRLGLRSLPRFAATLP